jgi:PBP1b-binding outer membrane lipoprotein LpoB
LINFKPSVTGPSISLEIDNIGESASSLGITTLLLMILLPKIVPLLALSSMRLPSYKTSEYIDTRVITEKIRTQLTKSGQVKFAVSISEMQSQEDELKRQNQSGLYKNDSIAKSGNMSGAKFRIEGAISSITKQNKDIKDIYYIFNLSLVNIETGLIEWADEKEIRKIEQR